VVTKSAHKSLYITLKCRKGSRKKEAKRKIQIYHDKVDILRIIIILILESRFLKRDLFLPGQIIIANAD